MTEENRRKIGEFLSEYIDINDKKYTYSDEAVIRAGLKILIEKNIFERRELKKVILKNCELLLEDEYFN